MHDIDDGEWERVPKGETAKALRIIDEQRRQLAAERARWAELREWVPQHTFGHDIVEGVDTDELLEHMDALSTPADVVRVDHREDDYDLDDVDEAMCKLNLHGSTFYLVRRGDHD